MEMREPGRGRRALRDRLVRRGTVFVVLPEVVVDHDLAGAGVAAQDRLKAVNDVRTTLWQLVGGLVVLLGAYATWRQLRVSQDNVRATQEGSTHNRTNERTGEQSRQAPLQYY
ncbi:hypothetical protein [Streptomyces sp. NPDC046939]|uniref:hypothetical protein n=1 Tax=Streptomyces sp. NPDC046939 TaxID=3155376 RepID=UPI00340D6460